MAVIRSFPSSCSRPGSPKQSPSSSLPFLNPSPSEGSVGAAVATAPADVAEDPEGLLSLLVMSSLEDSDEGDMRLERSPAWGK